jgi:hypothetical protein
VYIVELSREPMTSKWWEKISGSQHKSLVLELNHVILIKESYTPDKNA